jgi:DNA invertase Pin-like site-specific DNA recombinase
MMDLMRFYADRQGTLVPTPDQSRKPAVTSEHAIAIARVSSGGQREEDQTPGLVAYAERMGYTLDEVVPVHGRSAFHGKHVKYVLAAVDKHVKNGQATVVIFRHVDRSSREGVFKGIDLLNKIMQAGARIEFSEQEFLNSNPGWIGPLLELAKEESKIKRDRMLQGNAVRRVTGKLVGSVPWGYDAALDDNGSQIGIKPNPHGRKWIPMIFALAIEGKSLRYISDTLRVNSVPSARRNNTWDVGTVRHVIMRTTYYGMMTGNPNLKFEALISVETYKKANAAMASRGLKGRSSSKHEPALAKPICGVCYGEIREGAPSGRSPMYKNTVGQPNGGAFEYYRCMGHGPGKKGCGSKMIRCDALDPEIDSVMSADSRPYMQTVHIVGDDNAERRALIAEKIKVASEVGDFELVMQLSKEAVQIGPAKRYSGIAVVDSGMTVGQHWQTLGRVEKREELAKWEVIAWPDHVRILGPWHDQEGRTAIGDLIEVEAQAD